MKQALLVLTILIGSFGFSQKSKITPNSNDTINSANHQKIVLVPEGCNSNVSIPGPIGLDTSRYATIYLIREHTPDEKNYWMYVGLDSLLYIKTHDNEKYITHVYKGGNYEIWTSGETRSAIHSKIDIGKSYFIRLTLNKGNKFPCPILTLLDSTDGANAFQSSTAKPIFIDYPIPFAKNIPYSSQHIRVDYWDNATPLEYGELLLFQPSWAHVVEYVPFYGIIMFSYRDPLVSKTYSEFAELSLVKKKSFKDTTAFYQFLVKEKFDQAVDTNREVLITNERVYDIHLPGQFYNLKKIVSNDTHAKNQGTNSFLQINSYLGYFFVDDGKKGKVYKVTYSQRGVPQELHSEADFKCRFRDFAERIRVK